MWNQFSQANGKTLLLRIVEVLLVAKENNLVLEKHLVDRTNGLVGQIARQLDVPDLGTETRRAFDDVGSRDEVINGGRFGHGPAPRLRSLPDNAPPFADRGCDGGDETMWISVMRIYSAATFCGDRQTAEE
jgi:hypothetical protein